MRRLYPIALASLQTAAYSMEQAFFVPSVQHRVTSRVKPSSRCRATGLPAMATPTILSPLETPMENLCPHVGPWCRWCCFTKALASFSVIGTILKRSLAPTLSVPAFASPRTGRAAIVTPHLPQSPSPPASPCVCGHAVCHRAARRVAPASARDSRARTSRSPLHRREAVVADPFAHVPSLKSPRCSRLPQALPDRLFGLIPLPA